MPRDSSAPPVPRRPVPPRLPQPAPGRGRIVAACAAAAVVCAPLTGSFEGFVPKAKPDPVGISTGCFGERVDQSDLDPSRIYTRSECTDRLRYRLAHEYGPKLAACLPELTEPKRIKIFAAFLDASYNAGPVAVCNSRMARSVHAGQLGAACDGFFGWYATARDRRTGQRIRLRGLELRRQKEAALCADGVIADGGLVPVDYPMCGTVKLPPLLRSPHGRFDYVLGEHFNDRGVS